MATAASPAESRSERRKRETRERLLAASLEVFLKRGFDAATTGEIAAAADVGAGTFYLHFEDKRDAYQTLCRRAGREVIERWRARLHPGMPLAERIALALETASSYWLEDPARARLILEGVPTFGAEAHLRLLEHLAERMHREVAADRAADPTLPSAEVVATVIVGLAIELGRVVVGRKREAALGTIRGTIELARRTLCALPGRAPGSRSG